MISKEVLPIEYKFSNKKIDIFFDADFLFLCIAADDREVHVEQQGVVREACDYRSLLVLAEGDLCRRPPFLVGPILPAVLEHRLE